MKPILEINLFTTKTKVFNDRVIIKKFFSEKEIFIKNIKKIERENKQIILDTEDSEGVLLKFLNKDDTEDTFNFLDKNISEEEYITLLKDRSFKRKKRDFIIFISMVITILIILYFNNSFDFQKNEESRKGGTEIFKKPYYCNILWRLWIWIW